MANIKRIDGKTGPAYKITVTTGRDMDGKQVRHFKTWRPAPGMTERQMEKAAQKAALEFEREIELGYQADDRQTFAEYAEYVLDLKERSGAKYKTISSYRYLLRRINPVLGHLKRYGPSISTAFISLWPRRVSGAGRQRPPPR